MKRYFAIATALTSILIGGLNAQSKEVVVTSSHTTVTTGSSFDIAVTYHHKPDHWSYYNGSVSGLPIEFSVTSPEGINVGVAQLPKPKVKVDTTTQKLSFLYEQDTTALFKITVPENFSGDQLELKTNVFAQLCFTGGCIRPQDYTGEIKIKIGESSILNESFNTVSSATSHISSDIKLEVSHDDTTISYLFNTDLNLAEITDLYFTDPNSLAEPVASQSFEKLDNGYKLTLPRRKTISGDLVVIPQNVTGVLFSTSTDILGYDSLTVSTSETLTQSVSKTQTSKKKSNAEGFFNSYKEYTAEDQEAHAKLYNADEKIRWVSLEEARKLSASDAATAEADDDQTFIAAAFFAFVGGMILNLMPCVFPVLGLKVMGFAQLAGNDPKKIKLHGIVFTLGVVISMWILAAVILAAKAAIEASGEGSLQWGAQLQSPIFLGLIILLLFTMGLNMYGVFEMGTSLTSAGGNLQNKKGYSGSLFSGVLTTLIATPCSGPFLGAAMGYTLGLPALQAMVIFTVFALGISFPYLLLAFVPALINSLPKPGAWMEVMKKFMAFPLFATAIWFMATYTSLTGVDGAYYLSMAMVVIGLAAWVYGTWSNPFIAKAKRYIWGYGFTLLAVIGAGVLTYISMDKRVPVKDSDGWHRGIVEHHLSNGNIVWSDYTAVW